MSKVRKSFCSDRIIIIEIMSNRNCLSSNNVFGTEMLEKKWSKRYGRKEVGKSQNGAPYRRVYLSLAFLGYKDIISQRERYSVQSTRYKWLQDTLTIPDTPVRPSLRVFTGGVNNKSPQAIRTTVEGSDQLLTSRIGDACIELTFTGPIPRGSRAH